MTVMVLNVTGKIRVCKWSPDNLVQTFEEIKQGYVWNSISLLSSLTCFYVNRIYAPSHFSSHLEMRKIRFFFYAGIVNL